MRLQQTQVLGASFITLYFYLFVPFTTKQMSGGQSTILFTREKEKSIEKEENQT